jgi:hypothetical protein
MVKARELTRLQMAVTAQSSNDQSSNGHISNVQTSIGQSSNGQSSNDRHIGSEITCDAADEESNVSFNFNPLNMSELYRQCALLLYYQVY